MIRLILALLLLPSLAWAAAPRFLPTRDSVITYRLSGSDPRVPGTLAVHSSADLGRLRVDGVPLGYVLIDTRAERVELVMPQPRLVFELPPGAGITQDFLLGPDLRFTRTGRARILGRACTTYDVTADHGRAHGRVCLTEDGLLLRGEGVGADGRTASIEATEIRQTPQPVGLFSPPDTYRMMALPQ
jgi:hypothetical protein